MKKMMLVLFLFCFTSVPCALAKRQAPKVIKPIQLGFIEYRAPHDKAGMIVAWDTHMNSLLWERQIYVITYIPGLEKDVQDVFINQLQFKDQQLVIGNENGSWYQLDLVSLKVTVLKGKLVEGSR